MIQGFKDFIMRGNVVELAIAVVIGSAFAAVVDAFVSAIITPILNVIGSPDAGALGFDLRPGDSLVDGVDPTFVNIGAIVNALVVFLITALVVYFVFVVPMNKFNELQQRRKGIKEDGPAAPTDVELLAEIRDLLKAQKQA
ncbi:large conductance mechanosensitive channel protein MscL [Pseudactinotalea suaedae]|uniref:large conductance mechanosensitive channel protein MscL n=1 Tax=Pseudactinotalea suaedae TaxID=1524924 RepID=UPI0012E1EFF5|nr:large conductance mechanosensitive channel protein MscL [Pseudactinotalea suaedae]